MVIISKRMVKPLFCCEMPLFFFQNCVLKGCLSVVLRWARSRESYRRIASESYRSDSNH